MLPYRDSHKQGQIKLAKMIGDDSKSTFVNDFGNIDYLEKGKKYKDQETNILKKKHKRNLLTNAQKSFFFLEQQSLVHYIETDDEYIVSAGRDHDINIWDAVEGRHIRRLSGHTAPITGLHLHTEVDRIIISASEDGTLRKWSLNKGEELERIETNNLITCMGVINKVLVVTGNHKGYMEVRHLDIGELYLSIFAHEDPINALVVKGKYACSATFDVPSCLKIWEIQFERTTCIYRIENSPDIEFCSLAIWNTTVVLGASDERKLYVIDFKTDEMGIIDLGSRGSVQHVRIWNEWILSCSLYKREIVLDVHRIHNYEHFGTFSCNMKQVYATAAIESDSSFKIIIGGSALAILHFDFLLTQDANLSFERCLKSKKSSCIENKNKSPYTLKNTLEEDDDDGKELPNSDGDNNNGDVIYNSNRNIISELKQESETYTENLQKEKEFEINMNQRGNEIESIKENQMSNLTQNIFLKSIMSPNMKCDQLFMLNEISFEKVLQNQTEPRVVVRKLEKLLDEIKQPGNIKNCIKNEENNETLKETNIFIDEYDTKKHEENFNEMNEVTYKVLNEEENKTETAETNTDKVIKNSSNLLNINNNDLQKENEECGNEIPQKNDKQENSKYFSKFYIKKKDKGKSDKKKSEKAKHTRCLLM